MPLSRWRALAFLGLASCSAKSPTKSAFLEQLRQHPESFVAEVARARNLPVTAPVPVSLDDDGAFAAAKLAMEDVAQAVPTAGDTAGFYVAFHFAQQAPRGSAEASSPDEVLEEQLLGFYDDARRVIHVRRSKIERGGAADELELRFILGHEVEHALVHQRFGDQLPRALTDDDARVAKMALLEGDASFAAVLALAARLHRSPRRLLARTSDVVRAGGFDELAADNAEHRALRAAPANERAKLLFPYGAGLTMVNDLYRAGGLPLVDAAFSRSPLTTEHVLHPEKYIAGELPAAVRAPAAPPGFEPRVSGHMGEMMTSTVLARCMPAATARQAASGWGGDTYTLAADAQGRIVVLWSTAWDDEPSAIAFAQALESNAACLGAENRLKALSIAQGIAVAREGTRVGVVLGGPPDAKSLARGLPSLVGPTPAATPPFGDRTLVATKPRPMVSHGRLLMGTWVSESLGVMVPAWQGFEVEAKPGTDSFLMKADHPSFVLVALELLDERITAESTHRMFDQVERTLNDASKSRFHRRWEGPTELTLGKGIARQWWVPGTTFSATVSIVPICGGAAAYVVTAAWADAVSNNAVTTWLAGLRGQPGEPPISIRESVACRDRHCRIHRRGSGTRQDSAAHGGCLLQRGAHLRDDVPGEHRPAAQRHRAADHPVHVAVVSSLGADDCARREATDTRLRCHAAEVRARQCRPTRLGQEGVVRSRDVELCLLRHDVVDVENASAIRTRRRDER